MWARFVSSRSHYGFSILDIVRNNPKERTIYFGGVKGAAIRDFYRSVTYDLCDANGKACPSPSWRFIFSLH
jgi:fatty acid synthase subunit beta